MAESRDPNSSGACREQPRLEKPSNGNTGDDSSSGGWSRSSSSGDCGWSSRTWRWCISRREREMEELQSEEGKEREFAVKIERNRGRKKELQTMQTSVREKREIGVHLGILVSGNNTERGDRLEWRKGSCLLCLFGPTFTRNWVKENSWAKGF